ncbi:hypothetical protein [Actinomadura miaoliensis]|uniref:Uncharacterized protein n=1 Tax=Actinomadura miaoliensis TaxID=430685 RepID=A0ABP7W8W9_9ACTN
MAESPHDRTGVIVIDGREIYDLVQRCVQQGEQIIGDLKVVRENLSALQDQGRDHEQRIRRLEAEGVTRSELENRHRRTIGVITVIVSAVGVMVAVVQGLVNTLG